jgi:apolipoprotein N-acyltransferase
LLQPLIDDIAQRQAPRQYSDWHRAVVGTWLVVAGVYGAQDVMARYDLYLSDLVQALAGHPQGAASGLAASVIGFVIALFGCLWVVDGVPRERAPHSAAGVLSLFVLIGGGTYALLAASVMELFLFMRCAWDAPHHYPRREGLYGRTPRSDASAFGRARLARVARRRKEGFAQSATSGIL